MKITLEWTEEDINHIRKHNIEPKEIESIFDSKVYYKRRKDFYDFLGRTKGGRILFVVLERLKADTYRVAIARDATSTEKNLYVRRAK
jgi:uncharacterized DUF497 family protein